MHVATLSALERLEHANNVKVCGHAGTSAGALIAALAAVGYRSDEILRQNADGRFTSVALSRDGRALGFAGLFPWRDRVILRVLKWVMEDSLWRKRISLLAFVVLVYLVARLMSAASGYVSSWIGVAWAAPVSLCIAFLLLLVFAYAVNVRGLVRNSLFHDVLNETLSRKLGLECVTFGDLRNRGRLLNVVVTDVGQSREFLFSSCDPSVDHVSVARAVVASCAIPGVFRPVDIDGVTYVDGGSSSNLPAWVFDGQTVHDATASVVASVVHPAPDVFRQTLDQKGKGVDSARRGAFFPDLFRSLIFGSNYLHVRSVRQFSSVQLPTKDIGLLDLDFRTIAKKLDGRFGAAKMAAYIQLSRPFTEQSRHQRIHDELVKVFETRHSGDLSGQMRFRSSLVRGSLTDHPATALFSVWNCIGFDGDSDRHSLVAGEGSLIRHALRTGQPIAVDFSADKDKHRFREIDVDGLLWDRKPADIRWMLIVPLPEPEEPFEEMLRPEVTLAQYSVAMVIEGSCVLDPHQPDIKSAVSQTVFGYWQKKEPQNVRTGLADKET